MRRASRDGRRGLDTTKVEHAGRRARRAHSPAGPGRLLGPQRGPAPGAAGRRARPRPRLARRARAEAPGPGTARGRGRPPRRGGAGAGGPRARALGRADPGGRRRRRRAPAAGDCTIFDCASTEGAQRLELCHGYPFPATDAAQPRVSLFQPAAAARARRCTAAARAARARPRLHGRADEADAGQAAAEQTRRGPFVDGARELEDAPLARSRASATASSSAPTTSVGGLARRDPRLRALPGRVPGALSRGPRARPRGEAPASSSAATTPRPSPTARPSATSTTTSTTTSTP